MDREPAGRRRRGGSAWQNWPGPAVSPKWLLALAGTIAGIAVFAACALLLSHDAPRAAPRCPTGKCQVAAGQVSRSTPPLAASQATAHPSAGRSPTLSSSAPAPATMPAPATPVATTPVLPRASTPPPPTPSASPTPPVSMVSVSYTLVQQWDGGFQGQFTIVNNGSTAINGWQLSAVLPGDHIDTTWDASFQTNGDILIMNAPSNQMTISPGASVSEHFVAQGSTTSPAGCTFNGAAC